MSDEQFRAAKRRYILTRKIIDWGMHAKGKKLRVQRQRFKARTQSCPEFMITDRQNKEEGGNGIQLCAPNLKSVLILFL